MSNYKTVFFTLGVLLIVLGFSMLVPITIQLIYSEFNSTFVISSIITITFGALFFLANIDHNRSLSTQQAFLLTALSWVGVAIFGSIPFIFSDLNLSLTMLSLKVCLELQLLGQQLSIIYLTLLEQF